MPREGLRRSARASVSANNSRMPSPNSDDSDLELLQHDDSEDEYVAGSGGSNAGGAASDGGEGEASEDDELDEEDEDDDEDDDFDDDNKKGKGKGKGKGEATPRGKPGAGAGPSAAGGAKRKRAPPAPRKSKAAPRKGRPVNEAGRRSTAAARSNSTLNAYPQAYRELLLNSATSLVKKTEAWDKPTLQSFRAPPFPPGPVTPFVSRLAHAPGRSAADIAVTPEDSPHGIHRREHMRDIAKRVAVIPPWDGWEGEGWWPEMCPAAGAASADPKGKGKSKDIKGPVPGWTWREDVRLGLGRVGRYTPQDVMSESDGHKYLYPSTPVVLDIHDGEVTARHEMAQFKSVPIENTISKGFAFAAGAPAWGLDWCPYPDALAGENNFEQYVAVSTIPASAEPTTGSRCSSSELGTLQIWSVPYVDDEHLPSITAGAACELVLCFSGGPVSDIKWMPMGAWDADDDGGVRKLGIVAAVQLDGSTTLFAVPHPRALRAQTKTEGPIFLRAQVLSRFAVDDTACTAITWLSGHRLAAGLSNGHLAIWDAVDAIHDTTPESPLPAIYLTLALSSIRSIAAGRCPPTDDEGALDYTGETVYVAFGSYDGTTGVVDLRDPGNVIELNRSRLPCMATAWSSQVGVPLYADVDYMVLLAQLRASVGPATYYLTPHRGPVWEIGTSDYHTMVASASSDGSLLISNCGMGFYRRKQGGMLFQRLYELDYDEPTGSYRMTQDFMAEATGLEEATSKANHKNTRTKGARAEAQPPTAGDPATVKTGTWRPNVGIHRVVWQCGGGLARAGWIASCSAAGVVRVDNLRGQWLGQPK